GGSANGNLEIAGDHDWFGVSLLAGHTYVIDVRGQDSGAGTLDNPFVLLRNSAGFPYFLNIFELSSNDDGGVHFDSQLVARPLSSGTYYIDAQSHLGVSTGTYRVEVHDDGTSTNRFQTATLGVAGFGINPGAGGWDDFNNFPRVVGDI